MPGLVGVSPHLGARGSDCFSGNSASLLSQLQSLFREQMGQVTVPLRVCACLQVCPVVERVKAELIYKPSVPLQLRVVI